MSGEGKRIFLRYKATGSFRYNQAIAKFAVAVSFCIRLHNVPNFRDRNRSFCERKI